MGKTSRIKWPETERQKETKKDGEVFGKMEPGGVISRPKGQGRKKGWETPKGEEGCPENPEKETLEPDIKGRKLAEIVKKPEGATGRQFQRVITAFRLVGQGPKGKGRELGESEP
jgi:hypothetical protein